MGDNLMPPPRKKARRLRIDDSPEPEDVEEEEQSEQELTRTQETRGIPEIEASREPQREAIVFPPTLRAADSTRYLEQPGPARKHSLLTFDKSKRSINVSKAHASIPSRSSRPTSKTAKGRAPDAPA